jgi:hypothetical protein
MGQLRSKRTLDDIARLVEIVGVNRSQTTDEFIKDAHEALKSRWLVDGTGHRYAKLTT